jgi:hypothetical protein
VSKTGARFDDFRSCLYETTDYGETWTPITGDLPNGKAINVVVQDRKNAALLFVGTEQGVFVTLDGGTSWHAFKNKMPWVRVTDLVIHPRDNDLVVGTYGRGLYITDISALQEMSPAVLAKDVHLFDIEPRTMRMYGGMGNYQLLGDANLFSENESNAVAINYFLKQKAAGDVKITVADPYGKVVSVLKGKAEAGINSVMWDMSIPGPGEEVRPPDQNFWRPRPYAAVGEYVVTLEAGGQKLSKKAVIRKRQGWTIGPVPVEIK